MEKGGKEISTILQKGGGFKDFIFGGKGSFLEITIKKFTSRPSFNLLFTCRLKNAIPLVIFHLFLAYYVSFY